MLNRYSSWRTLAVWIPALLLAGLTLAACGGASAPATEAPPAPAESETSADTPTEVVEEEEVIEEEQESPATEESAETEVEAEAAAEEEAGAAQDENLLAPGASTSSPAECQAVDIPINPLVAAASEDDWSKGPADAALTMIEYGDFQ